MTQDILLSKTKEVSESKVVLKTNENILKYCRNQHEGTTTGNILDSAFIRMNTNWNGYYTLKKKDL